ncbi:hypothetical protein ACHAWF_011297 [Thalassiosira exigua]
MKIKKYYVVAVSLAAPLKVQVQAQKQHAKPSLRRTETVIESDGPKPVLVEAPDNSNVTWWTNFIKVVCVQDCEDGPPCGGPPPPHAYTFQDKESCCTKLFGGQNIGPCTERDLRAEVRRLIEKSERELIPKFLRLGFHDCVGPDGCDGCIDLDNPDHNGLLEPIEAIADVVEKFKEHYSRTDVWTMATLVSADMALVNKKERRRSRVDFPMRHYGRRVCEGANDQGIGGPDVKMPSNDLNTHELLQFFQEEFDFDEDETVAIMGIHSVAVATRSHVGFGNKDEHGEDLEEGWVFEAEEYELDNRYYGMLVGDADDPINTAPNWKLELVHNEGAIPSRFQWVHEEEGKPERPIMTNADMALVRDFSGLMTDDEDGTPGLVECSFKNEDGLEEDESIRRRLNQNKLPCPAATRTLQRTIELKENNRLFLREVERTLEKMVNNGYST